MNKVFERQVGSHEREQCIYTPGYILDCVDKVFPDGWWDPCPAEDASAPTARRADPLNVNAFYMNPPFKNLSAWLKLAGDLIRDTPEMRGLVLCPFRSRTTYFTKLVAGHPIAYLKAVKFHGYTGTFPENIVVIGYNVDPACMRDAFAPISHHFQERF